MEALRIRQPGDACKDALGLLGAQWGEADVLAGGTDLISLMKEYLATPNRVVNIKSIKELRRHHKTRRTACASAPRSRSTNLARIRRDPQEFPFADAGGAAASRVRRSATWERSAAIYASVRAAGISGKASGCSAMEDGKSLVPERRESLSRHSRQCGPAYFVSASSLGPALVALGANIRLVSRFRVAAMWRRRSSSSRRKNERVREKSRCCPTRSSPKSIVPIGTQQRDL